MLPTLKPTANPVWAAVFTSANTLSRDHRATGEIFRLLGEVAEAREDMPAAEQYWADAARLLGEVGDRTEADEAREGLNRVIQGR